MPRRGQKTPVVVEVDSDKTVATLKVPAMERMTFGPPGLLVTGPVYRQHRPTIVVVDAVTGEEKSAFKINEDFSTLQAVFNTFSNIIGSSLSDKNGIAGNLIS